MFCGGNRYENLGDGSSALAKSPPPTWALGRGFGSKFNRLIRKGCGSPLQEKLEDSCHRGVHVEMGRSVNERGGWRGGCGE